MKRKRWCRSYLLAMAVVLLVPLTAGAQGEDRYHSDEHQYSVTIPDGWQRISDEDLRRNFEGVIQPGQSFEYEAAFEPEGTPSPFSGPYFLLQVTPYDKIGNGSQPTESDIRAVLRQMGDLDLVEETERALTSEGNDRLENAEMGEVQYDPDTQSYTVKMQLQTRHRGALRTQLYGKFGRHAFIQLNFYTSPSEWEEYKPAYRQAAQSMEFDEDAAYRDNIWSNMPSIVRYMIIGGLIGLLVGGLTTVVKRFT